MSEPVEVTDRDWVMAGMAFLMLTLAVVLCVVNMIALSRQSDALTADARSAQTDRTALCLLDASIRDQRDAAIKYLAAHPTGAPALDLSAASIQQSIQKQTDQIEALRILQCPTH